MQNSNPYIAIYCHGAHIPSYKILSLRDNDTCLFLDIRLRNNSAFCDFI